MGVAPPFARLTLASSVDQYSRQLIGGEVRRLTVFSAELPRPESVGVALCGSAINSAVRRVRK